MLVQIFLHEHHHYFSKLVESKCLMRCLPIYTILNWVRKEGAEVHIWTRHKYSGISIYHSRNDRFPARTVRRFWSCMKFHINNIIYSRIHRFPNYRFTALIICKSRSQRSISRIDRLKKNIWSEVFIIWVTFSLEYKFGGSHFDWW